jgi:DNA-entry nuclease
MLNGDLIETEDPAAQAGTYRYVCNTNTKKFHYPSCDSVNQMNENNRVNTNLSRDELIAQGYQPCGNCRP